MTPRIHKDDWVTWLDQPQPAARFLRAWTTEAIEADPMHALTLHHPGRVVLDQASENIEVALEQFSISVVSRFEQAFQLVNFSELIIDLSKRVEQLEGTAAKNLSTVAAIQTFAPERYSVTRPIEICIRETAEGFEAFFFDANIGASGDNEQEAFDNIKSIILDVFDSLSREAPEKLGPEPSRQLEILRSFIGDA